MAYSDEELLADIRAVADAVERSPSLQDYRDHGEYSVTTIYRRFGSWQDAVARAGFEPRDPETEIPTEDLIDALQELADEFGESPTTLQMNEHGRYWSRVYRDRFGSWGEALDAAGLDPIDHNAGRRISDADLLDELERLADEVDGTPTSTQMKRRGAYDPETYRRHFGSWDAALGEIGRESLSTGDRVSDDELRGDLQRLGEELDRRPTADDVIDHGEYGLATYQRRFGSWRAALEAAGFDPDADRPSDDDLLAELHRLYRELEKVPSILDVEDESPHSPTTYQNRFGSWSEALEAAGFDPDRGPTDEELLAELRRLRDELDKAPSMQDMTDHGAYGCTTYARRFGSWSEAKAVAFDDENRAGEQ